MSRIRLISILVLFGLALVGCGFVGAQTASASDPPGFFVGLWHGLLAPYTLLLRFFMDIGMYAVPNSGWLYDCGFLIGVAGSLPIGWLAALLQVGVYVLS